MEHYLGVAKGEGLADAEIGAVQSIVMAVSAARVRVQFQEARLRSHNPKQVSKKIKQPTQTGGG